MEGYLRLSQTLMLAEQVRAININHTKTFRFGLLYSVNNIEFTVCFVCTCTLLTNMSTTAVFVVWSFLYRPIREGRARPPFLVGSKRMGVLEDLPISSKPWWPVAAAHVPAMRLERLLQARAMKAWDRPHT